MTSSHFTVNGSWQGNREGIGAIGLPAGIKLEVSVPKELDGPGIGTNPEELLVSSANNCYMITLASMLSNRKVEIEKLEVSSEGVVEKVNGKLQFKQIIHRPVISIKAGLEVTPEKIEEIAIRAEKACFIGNTLRTSVEITAQPKVVVL